MKLAICAGGTGGHIFPGIAVAEVFTAQDSKNEVVFIGTTKGLEGRLVAQAGFRLLYIEAHPFQGKSRVKKVLTLLYLFKGIFMSIRVLKAERPDAVLGMGGFTSVPVIIAGVLLRIPTFLHEQNVRPGLANKFLSKCTRGTFVSFEETRNYFKTKRIVHTGNPIRRKLGKYNIEKKKEFFGIFVFGGSQGAQSINDAIITLLPYLESYKNTVMYHQTGQKDFERMNSFYKKTSLSHEVFPFTNEMEKYYSLSNVVISRAGASTIFELAYFNKAAILIPYPYSAGGHQWGNATEVEKIGGAYVIANEEATGERLFDTIRHLMNEPELLLEMGENIGKLYVSDAAERIIGGIAHGLS